MKNSIFKKCKKKLLLFFFLLLILYLNPFIIKTYNDTREEFFGMIKSPLNWLWWIYLIKFKVYIKILINIIKKIYIYLFIYLYT